MLSMALDVRRRRVAATAWSVARRVLKLDIAGHDPGAMVEQPTLPVAYELHM